MRFYLIFVDNQNIQNNLSTYSFVDTNFIWIFWRWTNRLVIFIEPVLCIYISDPICTDLRWTIIYHCSEAHGNFGPYRSWIRYSGLPVILNIFISTLFSRMLISKVFSLFISYTVFKSVVLLSPICLDSDNTSMFSVYISLAALVFSILMTLL